MFVLCPECFNHYDDTSESDDCNGVGRSGHATIAPTPLESHVVNTKEARRRAGNREAGRSRRIDA